MSTLVSIDPGKKKYGWALFQDSVLVDCGHADTFGPMPRALRLKPDRLVLEHPKVYPNQQGQRTDPNDLLGLCTANGRVIGYYLDNMDPPGRLRLAWTFVFPHEWKGQTPKDIQNNRDMRKLEEHERLCVPNNHNVKDAVGVGLWALKRTKL